jgi:hypothetical protein
VSAVERFARVPEEMKAEAAWVLWRYDNRDGKPTKVLRQVNGRHADSTNAATWTTFGEALEAYERGGFDGIGFVFHPGNDLCGADLDDTTEGEAQRWLDLFDSYAERSPSGNGFHIICRARVLKGTNRDEGELYSTGRFFTVTGDVVRDAPVREAQAAADEFYAFLRRGDATPQEQTAGASTMMDAEVVQRAEGARNGVEFGTIYRGGGEFKSGSERDLSLASRIAFWTQDEAQIERIMRGSGCAREKWDKHRTYLRDTIRKALDGLTETYNPPVERTGASPAARPRTTGFSVVSGGRRERERVWPTLETEAYRGIFGRIVELAEEHTEGDPVALLASAVTAFGSAVGRGPYMQIGATRHHPNLFCGIVGDTAKGRKGSTWDPVENVMHASDRGWTENRIQSGLSSGEGLISEVRDPVEAPDKDGKVRVMDAGVSDKRLLVQEGELSQALKVMKREGNTLSPVLRNAWDGKTLKTMVKHSPLRATSPHVCILGHITTGELVKHLTETEMANGLANRFLWVLVKRSKRLPFGGEWHTVNLSPISREIVGALQFADVEHRMSWAEDAKPLWIEAYDALTEDRPGMFGAVTARAEAQTLRLAMLYALADCSFEIRRTHVESALAVWEYAEESARYIFGDAIGDADADKVLEELKGCEDGMTRTEVRDLFGRNRSGEELDRIMEVLAEAGRIRVTKHRENGSKKPVERWHAA